MGIRYISISGLVLAFFGILWQACVFKIISSASYRPDNFA